MFNLARACMTRDGTCGCEPNVEGRCIGCKCLTYEVSNAAAGLGDEVKK